MGRANNERPSRSSKAQQIFCSVIGTHHESFNILILLCKLFLSQVFVLDMGGSMLGYLNSHDEIGVLATYLQVKHGIPDQRLAQVIEDVFGVKVTSVQNPGTLEQDFGVWSESAGSLG